VLGLGLHLDHQAGVGLDEAEEVVADHLEWKADCTQDVSGEVDLLRNGRSEKGIIVCVSNV
jgi:hypothetical protein